MAKSKERKELEALAGQLGIPFTNTDTNEELAEAISMESANQDPEVDPVDSPDAITEEVEQSIVDNPDGFGLDDELMATRDLLLRDRTKIRTQFSAKEIEKKAIARLKEIRGMITIQKRRNPGNFDVLDNLAEEMKAIQRRTWIPENSGKYKKTAGPKNYKDTEIVYLNVASVG